MLGHRPRIAVLTIVVLTLLGVGALWYLQHGPSLGPPPGAVLLHGWLLPRAV